MVSKLSLFFLLFVLLSTSAQETLVHHDHVLKVGEISSALSSKGYIATSLILEQTLPTLLQATHNTTTEGFTVFCPPDKAFFSSKYPQPPLTLLQYHIVPLKLDREVLESSLQYESKVNTLLAGHPLVVTTIPHRRNSPASASSINGVRITEWDIYNDGRMIVHGVEDFFDPAFQILLYPWFDNGRDATKNGVGDTKGLVEAKVDWISWVKLVIGFTGLFLFLGLCLSLTCLRWHNRQDREHAYTYLQ